VAVLDHARPQPGAKHAPAGERPDQVEDEVVIDMVERSLKIGVEDPLPFRGLPLTVG
jgi:hypothetical protein